MQSASIHRNRLSPRCRKCHSRCHRFRRTWNGRPLTRMGRVASADPHVYEMATYCGSRWMAYCVMRREMMSFCDDEELLMLLLRLILAVPVLVLLPPLPPPPDVFPWICSSRMNPPGSLSRSWRNSSFMLVLPLHAWLVWRPSDWLFPIAALSGLEIWLLQKGRLPILPRLSCPHRKTNPCRDPESGFRRGKGARKDQTRPSTTFSLSHFPPYRGLSQSGKSYKSFKQSTRLSSSERWLDVEIEWGPFLKQQIPGSRVLVWMEKHD